MNALKQAIEEAGGVVVVSKACRVSPRAVYKWLSAASLPRTEYTGETSHAARISELAQARGFSIGADQLRADASPNKSVAA